MTVSVGGGALTAKLGVGALELGAVIAGGAKPTFGVGVTDGTKSELSAEAIVAASDGVPVAKFDGAKLELAVGIGSGGGVPIAKLGVAKLTLGVGLTLAATAAKLDTTGVELGAESAVPTLTA